jgi:hypothetical protein
MDSKEGINLKDLETGMIPNGDPLESTHSVFMGSMEFALAFTFTIPFKMM